MQKAIKYTIFKTKWGYFGLGGTENALLRTCLPVAGRKRAKCLLLKGLRPAEYDKTLFKSLQEQISAYFEGACINFRRDISLDLTGLSGFTRLVLSGCRDITYGRTISYGQLAEKIGRPGAVRAVGGALARNPLPLIIPCHRGTYANGKLGGFSAMGGAKLKKRMLELEEKSIKSASC